MRKASIILKAVFVSLILATIAANLVGGILAPIKWFFLTLFWGSILISISWLYLDKLRQRAERKRAAELKVQKALLRSDVFQYDSQTGQSAVDDAASNLLATPSLSSRLVATLTGDTRKKLAAWAEALERRYNIAKNHLDDGNIVINYKIASINKVRAEITNTLLAEYEATLRAFDKSELGRIIHSADEKSIEITSNFSFPETSKPSNIVKSINLAYAGPAASIANYVTHHGGVSKADPTQVLIAFGLALIASTIRASKLEAEQRTMLQEVQGKLDLFCAECSGALSALGLSHQHLTLFEATITETISKLGASMVDIRNKFADLDAAGSMRGVQLTPDQNASLETTILYGEQLKALLLIPLF